MLQKVTHSFQITFDITYIPAARAAGILGWLGDHAIDETASVEYATINNFEADYLGTLFKDADRCGRHRSWQNSTNICVMTTRCGKKYNLLCLRIEHWCDNGYVRQVAK